jgi:hypothetical protein
MASNAPNPVPTLDEKYSGTPNRLTKEATASRARLYSKRTKAATKPGEQRSVRLPPDITLDVFEEAIRELKMALGKDNVEVTDQILVDGWYLEHPNTHDAMHLIDQGELVSSAVVYPGFTEEVQVVVRWANKFLIPIYPISLGRNLG